MRRWLGLALLAPLVAGAALAGLLDGARGIDAFTPDLFNRLAAPGAIHWLGTDELGRDLFARLLHGARASLAVGIATALAASLIGTLVGLLAAWRGGVLDAVLMRLADGMLALPALPVLVVLAAVDTGRIGLPRGEPGADMLRIVAILAIFGWVPVARLARAAAAAVLARDYVRAARALGAGEARILARHVLPNVATPILVATALSVAGAILAESALSFLGLGIAPPAASWGNMLANAQDLVFSAPQAAIWPGVAILGAVAGCTLLAGGLRQR